MPPDIKTYDQLLAEYERERSDPEWRPVMTGFGSIDAEIRGISPGQVCGIAARTSVGKTWLLESIEHNFSARTDAGSISLSLEMPGVEWAERALAIHDDVAPEQVERWAQRRELAERARPFLDRMQNALVVDHAVKLNDLPELMLHAEGRLDVPVRLVLIDYLGLLGGDGRDAYERMSKLAIGLKMFAKNAAVAVVLAVQVNRAGGDGSEPVTREMMRDSGSIEDSVDFLLGCWRPGLKLTQADRDKMVQEEIDDADAKMIVAILKNRKGKQGRLVDLRFMPNSRRLYEPADPFRGLSETGGMR